MNKTQIRRLKMNKTQKIIFDTKERCELKYKNGSVEILYFEDGVNTNYGDGRYGFNLYFFNSDGYACRKISYYGAREKEQIVVEIKKILDAIIFNNNICFKALYFVAEEYRRKMIIDTKSFWHCNYLDNNPSWRYFYTARYDGINFRATLDLEEYAFEYAGIVKETLRSIFSHSNKNIIDFDDNNGDPLDQVYASLVAKYQANFKNCKLCFNWIDTKEGKVLEIVNIDITESKTNV